MKRSEEIKSAIKLKEQIKAALETAHQNRLWDLNRQITLLKAELEAIRNGKHVDAVITL